MNELESSVPKKIKEDDLKIENIWIKKSSFKDINIKDVKLLSQSININSLKKKLTNKDLTNIPEKINILNENISTDSFGNTFQINSVLFDEGIKIKFDNAIRLSAASLSKIIYNNNSFNLNSKSIKINMKYSFFNDDSLEGILDEVLHKVANKFEMELSTFVLMNIYLDTYADKNDIIFTWNNLFLLVVCCSLAALKYNEDVLFPLCYYAEVAGIEAIRLADLLDKFYEQLDFKLFVNHNVYKKYYRIMIKG